MAVTRTEAKQLKLLSQGKGTSAVLRLQQPLTTQVRDLYEIDSQSILFVATDRISAFDVVSNFSYCATSGADHAGSQKWHF
jgi:hypothetical protein